MTINDNSPAAKRAAKLAQANNSTTQTEEVEEVQVESEEIVDEENFDTADTDNEDDVYQSINETVTQRSGSAERTPRVKSKKELDAIESLNLPPHITAWDIQENPYDANGNIVMLYNENGPATYVEITTENLEELMLSLNEQIILLGDTTITGWTIRQPENPDLPPLLSFTSSGSILATIPLDKPFLKEIVPALLKHYNPNEKKNQGFVSWFKKHYILSGILTVMLLAVTVSSIINVFF